MYLYDVDMYYEDQFALPDDDTFFPYDDDFDDDCDFDDIEDDDED